MIIICFFIAKTDNVYNKLYIFNNIYKKLYIFNYAPRPVLVYKA